GDPLAPFLFILVMESFHLAFSCAANEGVFIGIRIEPNLTISHLFYADDAVFIGEWSNDNLKGILNILNCFSLLSGLVINFKKSHILRIGIGEHIISAAASSIGCSIMNTPFKYLGVLVGGNMSLNKAWDETVANLKKRLSKWKLKTLSIGGRLTVLKFVLGSTPIYNMSLFKVPKAVLNMMEGLRRNFFNGIQEGERKISWVKWSKILTAKKHGGLGVSSFFALNRALLVLSAAHPSLWSSIISSVNSLKDQGVDIMSHFKIRISNGLRTSFWKDFWIGDSQLYTLFPRLFALESVKDISVAEKLNGPLFASFRRTVRGGAESQQYKLLSSLLVVSILSNTEDRWVCDLNGDGSFRVKDVRNWIDESFLPKAAVPTRWVKSVPIKINIFAWKLFLDRLPT
nr:RNA-directed DNA polymerase, eukaryota, reverse transcriptase zinc-binding domain protein [Tanacetum cinerariifolium]